MDMAAHRILAAGVAAALLAAPLAASANPLKVVSIDGAAEACVFNTQCHVTVSDSTAPIAIQLIATPGTTWLQSRTYVGGAGSPGAGKTAYEYRVSFTQAAGVGCVDGMVLNFGQIAQLPYKNGQLADVYVITTGGVGTVGIASADQTGDVIQFQFSKQLCVSPAPDQAATTFFFGMAATQSPMLVSAQLYGPGEPPIYAVGARAPNHALPPVGGDPPAPAPGPKPPAPPKGLKVLIN